MNTITQFVTINPATGQNLQTYPLMKQAEVEAIIQEMALVQKSWSHSAFTIRKQAMLKMATILRNEKPSYATIITEEMGKPIAQAEEEIDKCAKLCEFYAEHGESFLEPEPIKTEYYKSYRTFKPLGIIFAIMPWNFPIWQVLRFAIPNIMAGNAGLLKHAPNCIGTSLAIDRLFLKAGFPKGLFRSLIMDVDLAPFVIHHPKIAGVTLTGSNRAGKIIAKEAGEALKKVVLELGGSDPYVILKDASLDFAAENCVKSRLNNCGQVCISAKRMIVVKEVREAFEALVLEKAKKYQMGNPEEPKTNLGPMARADLRTTLHRQVLKAIAEGARCVLGGSLPTTKGYYYPATILLDVKPGTIAFEEELFGPVICITEARDETHALELANQTEFGLAGAVFTGDIKNGERIARDLMDAGTIAVNAYVASDPRLPFGGIKESGYGRELSLEGIREFVNIKTVVVANK